MPALALPRPMIDTVSGPASGFWGGVRSGTVGAAPGLRAAAVAALRLRKLAQELNEKTKSIMNTITEKYLRILFFRHKRLIIKGKL